jgi:hypothetical protein
MRRLRVGPPSPALVIALIALFVSLGGVSYGLTRGSVTSRAIKNNTIRSKDVRNNNVRSKDIRNGTLRGKDIFNETITGQQILNGSLGAAETTKVLVRTNTVALPANSNASVQVSCNTGERMLGGGGNLGTFTNNLFWLSSRPSTATGGIPAAGSELTTWRASARNGTATATTLQVWANCLS